MQDNDHGGTSLAADATVSAVQRCQLPHVVDGVVYVVESGEYEQRGIWGHVYTSEEAAIADIKSSFGSPYEVRWDEPNHDGYYTTLTGHFGEIPGYSTEHTAIFDIRSYALVGSHGNPASHATASRMDGREG